MTAGSVCIAFGVMLPIAFHFMGLAGEIFVPMHLTVMITGLFLGGKTGFTVGVLTPFLSSLLTGMPPLIPNVPRIAAELGVYGLISGYLYKNKKYHILLSLLAAMVLGRAAALVVYYFFFMFLDLEIPPLLYIGTATAASAPGIAIQFLAIPFIVKKMETILQRNSTMV
jgi:uncharacterized membrane protein